jgi:hypothetical protein
VAINGSFFASIFDESPEFHHHLPAGIRSPSPVGLLNLPDYRVTTGWRLSDHFICGTHLSERAAPALGRLERLEVRPVRLSHFLRDAAHGSGRQI